MQKKFKKLLSLALACAMMCSMGVTAFASESSNLKVNMPIFTIDTDYSVDEAYVEYNSQGNKTIAVVRDINTSEVLEKYSETSNDNRFRTGGYITGELTKIYNPTKVLYTEMEVAVTAKLLKEVTAGITRHYIIELSNPDHYMTETGPFTIESKRTSVRTFTKTNCDINVVGVLQTNKSQTIGAELNASVLKNLGFSVSGSETTNWIARKSHNTSIRISV